MSFKKVLALSIAHSPDQVASNVRAEKIAELPETSKRIAALAIHHMATTFPNVLGKMLLSDYNGSYEYVGAGTQSTVIRDPSSSEVLKIVRDSIDMSEAERMSMASRMNDEHEAMRAMLSSYLLPQEIEVTAHPMVRELRAVVIRQPYVEFDELHLFKGETFMIDRAAIEQKTVTAPDLKAQLNDFVAASQALYDECRLVPDTYNVHNLTVCTDDNALTLVDGQPIGLQSPRAQQWVVGQLDMLQASLAA